MADEHVAAKDSGDGISSPGEAQLTARAVIIGCIVGSVIAATNITIGLKIGWTFGASIVSAVWVLPFSRQLAPIFDSGPILPRQRAPLRAPWLRQRTGGSDSSDAASRVRNRLRSPGSLGPGSGCSKCFLLCPCGGKWWNRQVALSHRDRHRGDDPGHVFRCRRGSGQGECPGESGPLCGSFRSNGLFHSSTGSPPCTNRWKSGRSPQRQHGDSFVQGPSCSGPVSDWAPGPHPSSGSGGGLGYFGSMGPGADGLG